MVLAPIGLVRLVGWGPRDALAFAVGAAASITIVVNALFLQSGPHPAPLFRAPQLASSEATNSVPVAMPRARPTEAMPGRLDARSDTKPDTKLDSGLTKVDQGASPPRPSARSDAPADAPSRRVMALQRALAQFGYGQIKPTGILDADTRAAIEKFERERKLPVTGQPTDRVVKELAGLTGRQID
jgi:Putative peptidoglycan binding domain